MSIVTKKNKDEELQHSQNTFNAVNQFYANLSAQSNGQNPTSSQTPTTNTPTNATAPTPEQSAPVNTSSQTPEPIKVGSVEVPDLTDQIANDAMKEGEAIMNEGVNSEVNKIKEEDAETARRNAIIQMGKDSQNVLYDYVKQEQKEMDRVKEEADAEAKRNRQATRWTAGTELATAIANMIGVAGFGASNQQYNNYSQSWMQKADQDTKIRRQEMANLRERLNRAKSAVKEGKIAADKALFSYDEQVRAQKAAAKKAEQDYQLEILKMQNEQANKNRDAQIKLAQISENARHNLASEAVSQTRAEIYRNSAEASAARNRASAAVMNGEKNKFKVSFPIPQADGSIVPEELTFNNIEALRNTLIANKGQLKPEQLEELELKLFGENANANTYQEILPLVAGNPTIMASLRKIALNEEEEKKKEIHATGGASVFDSYIN